MAVNSSEILVLEQSKSSPVINSASKGKSEKLGSWFYNHLVGSNYGNLRKMTVVKW